MARKVKPEDAPIGWGMAKQAATTIKKAKVRKKKRAADIMKNIRAGRSR